MVSAMYGRGVAIAESLCRLAVRFLVTRSLGMTFVFLVAVICHCEPLHLIHRKCGPPSPQGEGKAWQSRFCGGRRAPTLL